jgi:hypothetical protein
VAALGEMSGTTQGSFFSACSLHRHGCGLASRDVDGHGLPDQRVEAERHAAHRQPLAFASCTSAIESALVRAMASTASSARRAWRA